MRRYCETGTMKKTLLDVCQNYDQPAEVLWDVVADLDRYADHVTGLVSSPVLSGSKQGAVRECNTTKGETWSESVVEWVEGSHYVIEVDTSTYPAPLRQLFREFSATWTVKPTSKGCEVSITMTPDVRGGWLVWPVVALAARKTENDLKHTLKSYGQAT